MFSIIIPTFNRREELKTCIDNIYRQSVGNIEVLVSDDGSNDGTNILIERLNKEFEIIYIQDKNSGLPSVARNRAIKKAKNEIIAFCDSDDFWLPEKLSMQLMALNSKSTMAVCSNSYLDSTNQPFFYLPDGYVNTIQLLKLNTIICSSVIMEKSILDKCGFFDEDPELKACEDYLLWLKASLFTDFYYISKPLLHYTTASANSVRDNDLILDGKRKVLVYQKLAFFCLRENRPEYIPFILFYTIKTFLIMFKVKIKAS